MAILPEDITNAINGTPAPGASSLLGGNAWINDELKKNPAPPLVPPSGTAADTPDPFDMTGKGTPSDTPAAPIAPAAHGDGQSPAKEEAGDALKGIISHLPPFSIERLHDLRARMGDGLDLGIHFYTRVGDPYRDLYEYREEPLIFWGINIISARTSGGKTLMLKSFCNYLLHTKPDFHAVFFSLEESELDIEESLFAGYLWHKERFPWLPTDGEDGQPPELTRAITVKDIHAFTKYPGALDESQRRRLDEAARDLRERLHIVTIENLEEAALSFAGELEDEKQRAGIEENPPKADYSNVICAVIESYMKRYAGKVIFFIDYVQRVHHPDGEGNASYKELQHVMHDLMKAARAGAIMFLAAQSNRTVATGTAGGYAEKGATREAAEFFNVFGEQLREAADLEQGANKIIYSVIDRDSKAVNLRLTKARGDERDQFAAAPVTWGVQSVRLDKLTPPTLKHEDPKPKGTGGKGRNYKGDIMGTPSPAKEEAPDAEEQALIDLTEKKTTPRTKRRGGLMG